MRITYAHFGDTHCGLRNGLIAPGTVLDYGLDDQREVLLSSWSEWLWHDVWLPGIEQAQEFAGDDPLILLMSGDVVHGSRFVEHLYSPIVDHQIKIAKVAMQAWRKVPALAAIALVYGTGSHDYGENAAARLLKDELAPWGYPLDVADHLNLVNDGFRVDLAHHGPWVSALQHLRSSTARRYAELKTRGYLERHQPAPDWYCRGHVHQDAIATADFEFGGKYYQSHITINPPMCGPNGYARQASRSTERARCGMYLVEALDGKKGETVPVIFERDTRKLVCFEIDKPKPKHKKKKKKKK